MGSSRAALGTAHLSVPLRSRKLQPGLLLRPEDRGVSVFRQEACLWVGPLEVRNGACSLSSLRIIADNLYGPLGLHRGHLSCSFRLQSDLATRAAEGVLGGETNASDRHAPHLLVMKIFQSGSGLCMCVPMLRLLPNLSATEMGSAA